MLDSSLILSSMFLSYSITCGFFSCSSSEAILANAASRFEARFATVMFCVVISACSDVMLASCNLIIPLM
jgi:hypothetical protein